jgi:YHS domain-containing protein
VEYYFANITDPNHDSGWRDNPTFVDTGLDDLTLYMYTVRARDKSSNQNETAPSSAESATTEDGTAPAPDPMTWASEPNAISPTSITMTATTASDASGVEYYFTCTAGGGSNSGWQDSTTYIDPGLDDLTLYTYTVKARDKSSNQNTTADSTSASATTPDGTAPIPDPMIWAIEPYATGPNSIAMMATTASDVSGVEYYFTCTLGGGNDSGWQDDPNYEDTDLDDLVVYTYTVKARDKSPRQNETGPSTPGSVSTGDGTPPIPDPMSWMLAPYATGPTTISMTATPASDPSGVEYYFANITDPNHDSTWQDNPTYVDTGLNDLTEYTYTVKARDKSFNRNETATSAPPASATTQDGTPPAPDQMTWATAPYTTGTSSIAMVATTASDPSGVEYYFEETSGNLGATDSGWQDSPTYEDTGLDDLTQYTYTVKARDKSSNQNEGIPSTAESATTEDGTPPTPDPVTWASVPIGSGPTSIIMTATTVTDPSGVEYYFTCIAGSGHDSGWQDNTTYEDTGLAELTQYTYMVRARDKSSNQNITVPSTAESATTGDGTPPAPDPMTWASVPVATGPTSISMTADTASDASGVEYYFAETSGNPGGNDSGWQDSPTYEDTRGWYCACARSDDVGECACCNRTELDIDDGHYGLRRERRGILLCRDQRQCGR